jgi:hypothetical protein
VKILIIGSVEPYSYGDEEMLCDGLAVSLKDLGHETDVALLPFKRDMLSAAEQIFAYSLVWTDRADALVTVGYPACFVPHKNGHKVSYLFDCYPDIHENMAFKLREHRAEERMKIIERLQYAERKTFHGTRRIFVGSEILRNDLASRYGVSAETMRHPLLPQRKTVAFDAGRAFYMTESILSPETRFIEFLPELGVLDKPLYVFVPGADIVFSGAAERIIDENTLDVHLIDGNAPDTAFEQCAAYLQFDKNMRRVSSPIARAASFGTAVFYASDCGATKELVLNGCECSTVPAEFVRTVTAKSRGKAAKLPTMQEFAKRTEDAL